MVGKQEEKSGGILYCDQKLKKRTLRDMKKISAPDILDLSIETVIPVKFNK
jgi:hypothetical protein